LTFILSIVCLNTFSQTPSCSEIKDYHQQAKQALEEGRYRDAIRLADKSTDNRRCFQRAKEVRSYYQVTVDARKALELDSTKVLTYVEDLLLKLGLVDEEEPSSKKEPQQSKTKEPIAYQRPAIDLPVKEPTPRYDHTQSPKEPSPPPTNSAVVDRFTCVDIAMKFSGIRGKEEYEKIDTLYPSPQRKKQFKKLLTKFEGIEADLHTLYPDGISTNASNTCKNIAKVVYYYLGMIHYKIETYELALQYINQCLYTAPHFREAKDAKELIEKKLYLLNTKPNIDLDWHQPIAAYKYTFKNPYFVQEKEIHLQLMIESKHPLDLPNITTFVNAQKAIKADEGEKSGHRLRELIPQETEWELYVYQYNFYPLLSEGVNVITVEAKLNQHNYSQTTYPIHVSVDIPRNTLKIISIGTDNQLKFAENDADALPQLFSNQEGKEQLFQNIRSRTITGNDATADKIKHLLQNQTKIEDNLLIVHISSHGYVEDDELYIQGSDFDNNTFISGRVRYKDIVSILDRISCKKLLLIDACHSGGYIEKHHKNSKNLTIIASSKKEESSYEDPAWGNGAFTKAIIDGLQDGTADGHIIQENGNHTIGKKDGNITVKELFSYLSKNVPTMVADKKNGAVQTPVLLRNDLEDLIIYKVK